MIVHLIDGTYELFRHFYGLRSFNKGKDKPFGATIGLLSGILQMIEEGSTHLGCGDRSCDRIVSQWTLGRL
jgi:hypothetical protein